MYMANLPAPYPIFGCKIPDLVTFSLKFLITPVAKSSKLLSVAVDYRDWRHINDVSAFPWTKCIL